MYVVAFAVVVRFFFSLSLNVCLSSSLQFFFSSLYMYMYVYFLFTQVGCPPVSLNTHHFIFLDSQPLRIFLDDICLFFSLFICNTLVFSKSQKTRLVSQVFFSLNLPVWSFIDRCTLQQHTFIPLISILSLYRSIIHLMRL